MGISNHSVVFWFNQPPKVELGAYNELSHKFKEVLYVAHHDLPEERKSLGWGDTDYGNARLIVLPKDVNKRQKTINRLIVNKSNCIHIMCGLSGSIADLVCPELKEKRIKFIVVSERPRILFDSPKDVIRSIGLYLKHGVILRKRYEDSVLAILSLGEKGTKQFYNLGWPKEKLFHFMYCGDYERNQRSIGLHSVQNKIKMLYIGRFGYNHALDVLMKALDNVAENNWSFDMAGGYGDKKEEVFKWIERKENVNFIGQIPANEVQRTMSKYDILLVPSRLDGWNCQVNEALSIGVPVLTMSESVSGELVKYSGAGICVNSIKPKHITSALNYILKNPQIIEKWQQNALQYNDLFSSRVVGKYMYDILDFIYKGTNKRPHCPWVR